MRVVHVPTATGGPIYEINLHSFRRPPTCSLGNAHAETDIRNSRYYGRPKPINLPPFTLSNLQPAPFTTDIDELNDIGMNENEVLSTNIGL